MMKFQNSTEVNQGKHKISNFVLLSNEENLEFRKSKSQNISLLQLYDLLNTNYLKLKWLATALGLTTVASLYTLLMILTTLCNAATTFIINTYLQNWLKISRQILYLLEKYYFLTSNPLLLRILTAIVKHSSRQILTLFFTLRRSKLKFDRLISRSWQIESINISPKVVFSSASYPMLKVGVSGGEVMGHLYILLLRFEAQMS